MVEDPVEGCVREDRVDRLGELEVEEVGDAQLDASSPSALRAFAIIDGEASTPITRPGRQALEQQRGDAAAAAPGVEDRLVAAELEPVQITSRAHCSWGSATRS